MFHKASDPLLTKRESGGGHMQAVRVATFSAKTLNLKLNSEVKCTVASLYVTQYLVHPSTSPHCPCLEVLLLV